jgi:hypothetical protein
VHLVKVLGLGDHPPQKTKDFSIPHETAIFATAATAVAGFSIWWLSHGCYQMVLRRSEPRSI